VSEILFDGGAPHPWGNFFFGRAVPIRTALLPGGDTVPPGAVDADRRADLISFIVRDGKDAWKDANRPLLLLAVFVVLFVAAISVIF
jgi:hypothetical protein